MDTHIQKKIVEEIRHLDSFHVSEVFNFTNRGRLALLHYFIISRQKFLDLFIGI